MQHRRSAVLAVLALATCSFRASAGPVQDPGGGGAGVDLGLLQDLSSFLSEHEVTIRGSLSKSNQLYQRPATLQIRDDAGSSNTVSVVDIGVTWEGASKERDRLRWGPSVEYHRNTGANNEQDLIRAGFVVNYLAGSILSGVAEGEIEPGNVWFLQASAQYTRDEVADSNGAIVKLSAAPMLADWMLLPTVKNPHRFQFSPEAGVLFEDADGGATDGDVSRVYARGAAIYYPAVDRMFDRWDLHLDATYWRDLSQSGSFDTGDENHDLVRLGTTYYLDADKHFGLSFDYVNGENPEQRLPEQEYTLLSLAVRF